MNDRLGGSIPQMNLGGETPGPKRLFYSRRESALLLDKTVAAGYGVLEAGTVMAENDITKMLVPYPTKDANDNITNAKAYLASAPADSATDLYVSIDDSYKFNVADVLIIDGDTAAIKEVQSITDATPAENDVYALTFGDTTITTAALGSTPATAGLVAALQAATGYSSLPFLITAGSSAITLTWKTAGVVTGEASMEKTTGSGTPETTQTTEGVDADQDGTAAENLGAITAIDRTYANSTQAKITVSTGVGTGANFAPGRNGNVYVKGGDDSSPFTKAKYIIDKDIDTGVGVYAKGALTSVVISNAILYTASLVGMDSAAVTDMSIVTDGRFTVLK